MYYIGLDVHKKTIRYCVKEASGQIERQGRIGATRNELDAWMKYLPQPLGSGHGSDDLHGLDLRSSASACGTGEGGESCDAACDCGIEEEERPDRWRQVADCL